MGRYINATPGQASTVRSITTTYQALVNDRILADASGGAFTITLPAAADTMAVIAAATTLPDGIIKASVLLSLINPSSSKNRALSTNILVSVDETSAIILDVG